ncbi:MAG: hypothetical protein AAF417_18020 [Pseudomonadota bacterium]
MSNEEWQILEDAFAGTSGLSEEERNGFVDAFGREDPNLVDQPRNLLRADRCVETGLSSPTEAAAGSLARRIGKGLEAARSGR